MADHIEYNSDGTEIICSGEWDLENLPLLQSRIHSFQLPKNKSIVINGNALTKLDSAGAWLILNWEKKLKQNGFTVKLEDFPPQSKKLLEIVQEKIDREKPLPPDIQDGWLKSLGKQTVGELNDLQDYLAFVGFLTFEAIRIFFKRSRSRLISYATIIYEAGVQALFIIAVLSTMIGVVVAYQLGVQLRNYGAESYIVLLIGQSVLREFGPLITAIMVAGRTGSAFTAQIGMMRLNQEIDALDTMGVTPADVLILPRIVGLFIALPLLTMWANIFGVVGGMIMTKFMLNISVYDFIQRFPLVNRYSTLLLGLGKTPIFALIIASVGCYEGMRVSGGAESLGRNTTRSVVTSIFFILVADAIFSVIFSRLDF